MKEDGLRDIGSGLRVMDIACGKGGDIMKWYKNPCGLGAYIGVDIARRSLEDFAARLQTFSSDVRRAVSMLLCGDMGAIQLPRAGQNPASYGTFLAETNSWLASTPSDLSPFHYPQELHVVSCQFALHYIFESESRCRHFFSQVSSSLMPGGYFIATTVDCAAVVDLLCEAATMDIPKDTGNQVIIAINKNGQCVNAHSSHDLVSDHIVCRISFTRRAADNLLSFHRHSDHASVYGIKYNFELFDDSTSVNDVTAAVDAPEWIVPASKEFQNLCSEYDLELVDENNFHEFVLDGNIEDDGRYIEYNLIVSL